MCVFFFLQELKEVEELIKVKEESISCLRKTFIIALLIFNVLKWLKNGDKALLNVLLNWKPQTSKLSVMSQWVRE